MNMKRVRTALLLIVIAAVQLGLYQAYVDHPSRAEWAIGIAAALLATIAAYGSARVGSISIRPTFSMIAQGWRVPGNAVSESWDLLVVTVAQLLGRKASDGQLVAAPFRYGTLTARDSARRLLAVIYTTLTPNSVVIGLVREQNLILIHQMRGTEVSPITQELGAEL
jgi:hypothetical protein